ncbi:hypothetical protein OIU76_010237 [Salix suchowensis]|nr:hypothetical protein OIU76_010237 [Salix suchowensis]
MPTPPTTNMNPEESPSIIYCPFTLPGMKTRGLTDPVYGSWVDPNTRRFNNDVIDDAGDDHEVGEEDQREDCHGGRESEGGEFETEAWWAEDGVRKKIEEEEERVHGGGG